MSPPASGEPPDSEPPWLLWPQGPRWLQYVLASWAAVAGLVLGDALGPWLGPGARFLPLFAVLLVLGQLVRPGPLLAAGAFGGLGMAWGDGGASGPTALGGFAVLALGTGCAAWLSAQRHEHLRAAWRQVDAQCESLRARLARPGDSVDTTDASGRVRVVSEVESEQRFQLMADSAPVLIWTSGRDGGRTWFNKPWQRFTGRGIDADQGEGWVEQVHPDDRERCLETTRQARADRSGFTMDYRLLRHDGEYRWLLGAGAPRFDADGAFVGHIASCVDITDRKTAEAALTRSEALFRRIADADLIGVAFGDTRGGVSYVNDEMLRMMGRTREDFEAGRIDWVRAVAPEFAHLHDDWRTRLMKDGQVGRYERAFERPDGTLTPYMGAAALLTPGSGSDMHVRIALDLTPLRRSEASRDALVRHLRETDRRKDEFLATLAHELRNPLAPALHALEIVKRPAPPRATPAAARALATLERQLQHMVRLIDDLLDVNRITRDRLELRSSRVDLLAVLEHAVEVVRPALSMANQPLHLRHPEGPLWLHADPVRLSQVFSNLLGNAGKYSPPGSPVHLHVAVHADAVEVTVRDEGAGIARRTLPQVFDMFVQGDVQPGQVRSGLGIGLALAKRLTEMHRGQIRAHSAGRGCGSEFTVRLPRAASDEEQGDGPAPPQQPDVAFVDAEVAPAPSWRVLVVDDNVDAATTLALLMEMSGHVVALAHDGIDALATAERFRPDVALLDIGLPRMDGLEVARRLRAQAWASDVVLVALTGWGQAGDREASNAVGFDAHVVKPVEHEVLMAQLQALMEGRGGPARGPLVDGETRARRDLPATTADAPQATSSAG